MCNSNLLTLSTFLHLGKANEFALLSVYETSSAFDVLSASCCLSHSPLNRAPLVVLRNAIESHRLSSCTAICSTIQSKLQEMNL